MGALSRFYSGLHRVSLAAGCVLLSHVATANVTDSDTPNSEALKTFVDKMVTEHGFEPAYIRDSLANANKNQAVLDAISRPWEAKPWYQYRPIFLTDARIEKGVEFWKEHNELLTSIEQKTGVPAHIIVAIIGVETYYGKFKGKYPVLDALYSLAFYYPPRSKFFTQELEQYFLLTREEQLPLTELKGSYAGAMGWGQFISSSYRHYAIDQDADGKRDLLNNPSDAIGSVANYFVRHGWQEGQDVAYPLQNTPEDVSKLVSKPLKYSYTWQHAKEQGISIEGDVSLSDDTKVKVFEFEQADSREYWLGLPNFYVITRYNHSPLYAMAVYQLSEAIREQKQ